MNTRSTKDFDPVLAELIKTFSEDVGPNGQAAWRRLEQYPRKDLIDSILAFRSSLPNDDPKRLAIAFVLANLKYEYPSNVEQLVSAVKAPNGQNENADDAAMMLGRLVHNGDKELLKVLFTVAPSADAALGEALSEVFSRELRDDPQKFLARLKDEPRQTRMKTYGLIESGPLTERDREDLRQKIISLSKDRPTSEVAKEILVSSVFKK